VHACMFGYRQSCTVADQQKLYKKRHETTKQVRFFNLIHKIFSGSVFCNVVG